MIWQTIITCVIVVKDNIRQQYASDDKNYITKICRIKLMKEATFEWEEGKGRECFSLNLVAIFYFIIISSQ